MQEITLERQLVESRNKVDLLEQENSELRRDIVERLSFNKLMLDSRIEAIENMRKVVERIDKFEDRLYKVEQKKEATKFRLFSND